MSNANTGSSRITTLIAGDLVYIPRTSDNSDRAIEKTDLDTYIFNQAKGSFASLTIADGAPVQSVGCGAFASFEGFKIDFIISSGTNRYVGFMFLSYDNAAASAHSPRISKRLVSGLNIQQASIAAGQFYWKITNNSGGSVTIKYKITQYDAI